MKLRFFIVDAFTDEPFFGNPAGVVLVDQSTLSDELMQRIASELRYSETAFVRRTGVRDFEVRYFTPVAEVELCGHATIATFEVLRSLSMVGDGDECTLKTKAGDLKIYVDSQLTFMEQASPKFGGYLDESELGEVAESLSIEVAEIVYGWIKPALVSTGLWDLLIPLESGETLLNLTPDFEKLKSISRRKSVVSLHVFHYEGEGAEYICKARDFAPLYGIPEEAATGTANGALAYLLYRNSLIVPGAVYKIRQGESLGRPSDVYVRVEKSSEVVEGEGAVRVLVGGKSRILASGELSL